MVLSLSEMECLHYWPKSDHFYCLVQKKRKKKRKEKKIVIQGFSNAQFTRCFKKFFANSIDNPFINHQHAANVVKI